ncbi:scaffold/adaptor protein [Lithospermum erythrorhizon]|uniref:Scaffold/adaptor protein n=1 Tax=Lithospermum erythrorhizon TaxID=34254 RepID=A0AAV3QSK8_LITER
MEQASASDPNNEKPVTINVKFSGRLIPIEIPLSSTVKDLKSLLQPLTNVLPRGQKLISKGKVLRDEMTLMESELSHGAKLMLMATQGLHQGDGPIRKETPTLANSRRIPESTMEKTEKPVPTLPKTQLERWKATGIIALSHSDFTAFPDEVWACGSSARVLDISGNSLKEVPDKLGSLNILQKLNLSANGLLNDSICWEGLTMLKSLIFLSLNQNLYVCQLGLQNLLTLSIENKLENLLGMMDRQRLTSLPSAIGMLGNLRRLDISHNKLTSFPDEIGLLTRLEVLKASNNRISYIPQSIGTCISLVEVHLSFNLLTELPSTFGELKDLKLLYLCNNGLKTLPSTLFKNCLQLSTLDLHGTEITNDLLRQFEGWEEFEERRCLKHQKQLDFRVISSAKFDEGADKN